MKRTVLKKTVSLLLLFVFLFTALLLPASRTATGEEYSDATTKAYEEELARLRGEQDKVWANLTSIRSQEGDVEEYIASLKTQIATTEDKVEVSEKLLASLEASIASANESIEEKTARIDEIYANFLNSVRISYEEGTASYLEILLDSRSLSDFLSRTEQVNSLLSYDLRLKKKLEATRASLEDDRATLEEKYEKQKAYREELDVDRAKLNVLLEEQETNIKNLQASEAEAAAQYAKYQAEKEKVDAEMEAYIQQKLRELEEQRRREQEAAGTEYVGGMLSWPVDGSLYHIITSSYGQRTYLTYGYWTTDYHHGIDINAGWGTDVHAANAGTVAIAGWSDSYGYYVLIDHGGGYSTLYAHNSSLCVTAGQTVTRGQLISYSGNTGWSFGAHLHFEVRYQGSRIDPLTPGLLSSPSNLIILE
ncbi:MAG: peptidoglycan DD-metalloendopeptidase family protein [Clostridia bacterium]|nr:peptidoglycan DD-metalloendopeptidase family protein [Clostridia bacterium]